MLSLDCDDDDDAGGGGGGDGDGDVTHNNQQNGSSTHFHWFGCLLFQVLQRFSFSLDWFKGKSTGNHDFYQYIWRFPVNFSLKQSNDLCHLVVWAGKLP
jgi:hypothetical protein